MKLPRILSISEPESWTIKTEQPHGLSVGQNTRATVAGKPMIALVTEVRSAFEVKIIEDKRNRKQRRAAKTSRL